MTFAPTPPALAALLDDLCPMHLAIGPDGRILHAGPTFAKIVPDGGPVGRCLFDLFHLQRPRSAATIADLRRVAGRKLHLHLRAAPDTRFKGVYFPLPDGSGGVLNLSFGIGVIDAVGAHRLNASDFAHTDLAIEMLYLVEAKTAVMEETRDLNARLENAMREADERSLTDPLTGLRNRRAFDRIIDRMIAGNEDFALMQVDLDHFKEVNDAFGHAAGDHVLRAVATVLCSVTRMDDFVMRMGGDEFLLIFRNLLDPAQLDEIALRIIAGIETPVLFKDNLCRISASVGTTLTTLYSDPDPDVMMTDADRALYSSKESGRAQHSMHRSGRPKEPPRRGIASRA